VYGRALGTARPARSTVQVSALPRGVLVEIDAIAVVP
jgi:2-iminobutanoate/2-iminopropanoate deaminase